MKEFNKPYLCGLTTLALLGCQSEDSIQEPVSVLVPYNINELPKPNDGYGYDDDGTITGVGEDVAAMSSTNDLMRIADLVFPIVTALISKLRGTSGCWVLVWQKK